MDIIYDPIFGFVGISNTNNQQEENMFEIVSDSAGMPTTLPFNAPKRERGRKMKLKNGLMYASDGTVYDPRHNGWRRVGKKRRV